MATVSGGGREGLENVPQYLRKEDVKKVMERAGLSPSEHEVQTVFELLDTDNDGLVALRDFETAILHHVNGAKSPGSPRTPRSSSHVSPALSSTGRQSDMSDMSEKLRDRIGARKDSLNCATGAIYDLFSSVMQNTGMEMFGPTTLQSLDEIVQYSLSDYKEGLGHTVDHAARERVLLLQLKRREEGLFACVEIARQMVKDGSAIAEDAQDKEVMLQKSYAKANELQGLVKELEGFAKRGVAGNGEEWSAHEKCDEWGVDADMATGLNAVRNVSRTIRDLERKIELYEADLEARSKSLAEAETALAAARGEIKVLRGRRSSSSGAISPIPNANVRARPPSPSTTSTGSLVTQKSSPSVVHGQSTMNAHGQVRKPRPPGPNIGPSLGDKMEKLKAEHQKLTDLLSESEARVAAKEEELVAARDMLTNQRQIALQLQEDNEECREILRIVRSREMTGSVVYRGISESIDQYDMRAAQRRVSCAILDSPTPSVSTVISSPSRDGDRNTVMSTLDDRDSQSLQEEAMKACDALGVARDEGLSDVGSLATEIVRLRQLINDAEREQRDALANSNVDQNGGYTKSSKLEGEFKEVLKTKMPSGGTWDGIQMPLGRKGKKGTLDLPRPRSLEEREALGLIETNKEDADDVSAFPAVATADDAKMVHRRINLSVDDAMPTARRNLQSSAYNSPDTNPSRRQSFLKGMGGSSKGLGTADEHLGVIRSLVEKIYGEDAANNDAVMTLASELVRWKVYCTTLESRSNSRCSTPQLQSNHHSTKPTRSERITSTASDVSDSTVGSMSELDSTLHNQFMGQLPGHLSSGADTESSQVPTELTLSNGVRSRANTTMVGGPLASRTSIANRPLFSSRVVSRPRSMTTDLSRRPTVSGREEPRILDLAAAAHATQRRIYGSNASRLSVYTPEFNCVDKGGPQEVNANDYEGDVPRGRTGDASKSPTNLLENARRARERMMAALEMSSDDEDDEVSNSTCETEPCKDTNNTKASERVPAPTTMDLIQLAQDWRTRALDALRRNSLWDSPKGSPRLADLPTIFDDGESAATSQRSSKNMDGSAKFSMDGVAETVEESAKQHSRFLEKVQKTEEVQETEEKEYSPYREDDDLSKRQGERNVTKEKETQHEAGKVAEGSGNLPTSFSVMENGLKSPLLSSSPRSMFDLEIEGGGSLKTQLNHLWEHCVVLEAEISTTVGSSNPLKDSCNMLSESVRDLIESEKQMQSFLQEYPNKEVVSKLNTPQSSRIVSKEEQSPPEREVQVQDAETQYESVCLVDAACNCTVETQNSEAQAKPDTADIALVPIHAGLCSVSVQSEAITVNSDTQTEIEVSSSSTQHEVRFVDTGCDPDCSVVDEKDSATQVEISVGVMGTQCGADVRDQGSDPLVEECRAVGCQSELETRCTAVQNVAEVRCGEVQCGSVEMCDASVQGGVDVISVGCQQILPISSVSVQIDAPKTDTSEVSCATDALGQAESCTQTQLSEEVEVEDLTPRLNHLEGVAGEYQKQLRSVVSYLSMVRRPGWVMDNDTSNCTGCAVEFGVFKRRHHCRSCGFIFCDECSKEKRRLPWFGYKSDVRCCKVCTSMVDRVKKSKRQAGPGTSSRRTVNVS